MGVSDGAGLSSSDPLWLHQALSTRVAKIAAMVRMDAAFAKAKLSAQMLSRVRDKVVFEMPDSELEATVEVVCKVMAHAPLPFLQLAVPLQVEAKAAQIWGEAH